MVNNDWIDITRLCTVHPFDITQRYINALVTLNHPCCHMIKGKALFRGTFFLDFTKKCICLIYDAVSDSVHNAVATC